LQAYVEVFGEEYLGEYRLPKEIQREQASMKDRRRRQSRSRKKPHDDVSIGGGLGGEGGEEGGEGAEDMGSDAEEGTQELVYREPVVKCCTWGDMMTEMRETYSKIRPQLILTDPPYGVLDADHDRMTLKEIRSFCRAMSKIIHPSGTMLVFIPHHRLAEWTHALEEEFKIKGERKRRAQWKLRQVYET
jgi:hypothetical protein